jgi:hypothetical protein
MCTGQAAIIIIDCAAQSRFSKISGILQRKAQRGAAIRSGVADNGLRARAPRTHLGALDRSNVREEMVTPAGFEPALTA